MAGKLREQLRSTVVVGDHGKECPCGGRHFQRLVFGREDGDQVGRRHLSSALPRRDHLRQCGAQRRRRPGDLASSVRQPQKAIRLGVLRSPFFCTVQGRSGRFQERIAGLRICLGEEREHVRTACLAAPCTTVRIPAIYAVSCKNPVQD